MRDREERRERGRGKERGAMEGEERRERSDGRGGVTGQRVHVVGLSFPIVDKVKVGVVQETSRSFGVLHRDIS
uniref:Uncharacterized protein n=1 Tax=Oryza sativa subsp. japonica TaxID=39947 RepID=Q69IT2_ORYSJ|nr:hypothetical protein [Oryza sativa Japonica Group]